MARPDHYITTTHPKTLLIAVHAPYNTTQDINSYYEEFINLVKSNQIVYDEIVYIKLRTIDTSHFFTSGKLDELRELCEKLEIEQAIISEPLTVQQERNVDAAIHCRLFDRTQLILDIFEKNAHSAEGKAQVAIAMMEHKKTRMAGKGVHLAQQRGVRGLRSGPGEAAKEKEKRHIETTILKLRRQLTGIQHARETQRKQRILRQIPHICLIGYTNAGKSSILNALTKSSVLAEDRLFATLDTTTRELYIDGVKKGILSDTVGFIQQLPHQLIDAFKSTLSELHYADLLLQVIDISDPNWQMHINVVHQILDELEVHKDMVYVFNKADKIDITTLNPDRLARYQPHVFTSTLSKEGMAPLVDFLRHWQRATPEAITADTQTPAPTTDPSA